MNMEDQDDNVSSRSESSQTQPVTPTGPEVTSPRLFPTRTSMTMDNNMSTLTPATTASGDGLRRAALASNKTRVARVHSVLLCGPAG